MTVKSIYIKNYRNFQEAKIEFHDCVNIIMGGNANGKTNLLESLCYLSTLRGIRPSKDSEIIRHGAENGHILATVQTGERKQKLDICLSTTERRRLCLNGVRQRSGATFAGVLKTVIFSPDDLFLIKEGAVQRRRLLDGALCQMRPAYFSALSEYTKLLQQKSRILKNSIDKPSLLSLIPQYNERMAQYGARIIALRHAYSEKLSEHSDILCRAISGNKDSLSLKYRSLSNITDTSLPEEELYKLIIQHQKNHHAAEMASRSCLSGPHKDDLEIEINGILAKSYASQGQIRSAVLSIKLAQREIFFEDSGSYPILLLDDVLSELDADRQSFVLNKIGTGQVFITSCSADKNTSMLTGRSFQIENGAVTNIRDL